MLRETATGKQGAPQASGPSGASKAAIVWAAMAQCLPLNPGATEEGPATRTDKAELPRGNPSVAGILPRGRIRGSPQWE